MGVLVKKLVIHPGLGKVVSRREVRVGKTHRGVALEFQTFEWQEEWDPRNRKQRRAALRAQPKPRLP